jgi:hypothetical protein
MPMTVEQLESRRARLTKRLRGLREMTDQETYRRADRSFRDSHDQRLEWLGRLKRYQPGMDGTVRYLDLLSRYSASRWRAWQIERVEAELTSVERQLAAGPEEG